MVHKFNFSNLPTGSDLQATLFSSLSACLSMPYNQSSFELVTKQNHFHLLLHRHPPGLHPTVQSSTRHEDAWKRYGSRQPVHLHHSMSILLPPSSLLALHYVVGLEAQQIRGRTLFSIEIPTHSLTFCVWESNRPASQSTGQKEEAEASMTIRQSALYALQGIQPSVLHPLSVQAQEIQPSLLFLCWCFAKLD